MDILTKEITSKNVRGSNVDFSTIEITSKKVCRNNMDFSTIEITSEKVREMTRFFDQQNYIKKVLGNDVEICRNLVFDVAT